MINVELFENVKKHILDNPQHFDMGLWGYENYCGTAACIAGWAWKLTHPERHIPHSRDICTLLGISANQGDTLFFTDRWPEPFQGQYNLTEAVGDQDKRAEVAAKRIDHFLQTGE